MAKKEARPRAKMLTAQQVVTMVKEWQSSTPEQLAEKFSCSVATIRSMATELRKNDPSLCPKRRSKREDIVKAALAMLKQ